jgi:purine-binding chemotaxis protein CheW
VSDTMQLSTFTLDGFHFGVEVEKVQEVLRFQEMTRVPLAPAAVSGLINLRGQIVTAINLRKRLGLREAPPGQRPMSVILRFEDAPVSLLVDEIGEVLAVEEGLGEAPPETLHPLGRELVKRVYKLTGRLLLVLDAEKAVDLRAASTGSGMSTERERNGR